MRRAWIEILPEKYPEGEKIVALHAESVDRNATAAISTAAIGTGRSPCGERG